jgi:YD repeat-containing protein
MNKPRSRLLSYLTGASARNGGSACGDSTLRLFRHTAISVIEKIKSINWLARIPMLFVFMFSMQAVAAEYYWEVTGVPISFKTPEAGCEYALDNYNTIGNPGPGDRGVASISEIDMELYFIDARRPYYICSGLVKFTSPWRKPTYMRGLSAAYRAGDTCPLNSINNPTTAKCANDSQKGDPGTCPKALVHDPINAAVGNSFQTEVDSPSSNLSTLHFTRVYNSLDGLWRHNHSTYLRLTSFAAALVMADGRESFFTLNGSTVTASPTELGRLTKAADTWLYTAKNNDTYSFDATGRLTRWTNAAGAEHLLTYVNGTVTVTDNLGQNLSFTEDAQHQPLTLTTAGLTIQYEYNANQRLGKLTRTRGGQTEQRLFHYEKPNKANLLTGITDERGVRFTTWTFDDQDRATSSEHAGGVEHGDVAYNADGSSTVINEFGKKSIYRFVTIDGVKRVSAIEGEALGSCPMSNSTFTYDARGLLKTKSDNKGFVTTYIYNTRGLEITRTEATGTPQARTTTTTWHATLNLPLTVTEPGRVTTYSYDAQGRQLNQTSASTAL